MLESQARVRQEAKAVPKRLDCLVVQTVGLAVCGRGTCECQVIHPPPPRTSHTELSLTPPIHSTGAMAYTCDSWKRDLSACEYDGHICYRTRYRRGGATDRSTHRRQEYHRGPSRHRPFTPRLPVLLQAIFCPPKPKYCRSVAPPPPTAGCHSIWIVQSTFLYCVR
jgi:hypothetical protein